MNYESLFGSLNTDHNLIEQGNIVLGSNLNNSANNDEDEIVFQEPTPVTNGTDDELSSDEGETETPSKNHVIWTSDNLALEQAQATY